MLKTRITTALILVLIVLAALFGLPAPGFTVLVAAIVLGIGGWETATLAGLHHPLGRAAWILSLLLLGAGAIGVLHQPDGPLWLFGLSCLLWLLLLGWLGRYSLGLRGSRHFQLPKLLVGGLILLPAFAALAWLQFQDPWLVLFPIAVVATADISAYFTGRALGGPKLAPVISPGKTWSGAGGGLVGAGVLAALAAAGLNALPLTQTAALMTGLLLAAVSIGGDLLISLLKRHRGLKDTSALLPGHGGLLDRIDGLCAALPFFAWVLAAAG